jgi:hypothetical protein
MSETKTNAKTTAKTAKAAKPYYMVRSNGSGVWAGNIESREGDVVTMTDARRIWQWKGANSLSQLAMEGTKNPAGCCFAVPVGEVVVFNVLEIITCTEDAEKNIREVKEWRA